MHHAHHHDPMMRGPDHDGNEQSKKNDEKVKHFFFPFVWLRNGWPTFSKKDENNTFLQIITFLAPKCRL